MQDVRNTAASHPEHPSATGDTASNAAAISLSIPSDLTPVPSDTLSNAITHPSPPSGIPKERRWMFEPLQLFLIDRVYETHGSPDWASLAAKVNSAGLGEHKPEQVREIIEHAIAHLKRFEDGWQWLASICGTTVRDAKNHLKLSSAEEAEATLRFFGIGGPREVTESTTSLPVPVRLCVARIKGTEDESPTALRTRPNMHGLSARLRSVLSELYRPESKFTDVQITSHISALGQFSDWNNHDAVLDAALLSSRYLHYTGQHQERLRRAIEAFLKQIPEQLFQEQPTQAQRPHDSHPLTALDSIVRTVLQTPRLNFLGEIVVGSLLNLYKTGATADSNLYQDRRDLFISSKYTLLVGLSKELGSGVPREDLIHEGLPDLMKAVDSFDPSLGFRFSSHAYWPIKNAMRRMLQKEVRERSGLPLKTQDELTSFERDCERADCYVFDPAITDKELLERLNKLPGAKQRDVDRIHRLRSLLQLAYAVDLAAEGKFIRGSKISIDAMAEYSEQTGGPKQEIADERDFEYPTTGVVEWISNTLSQAWEDQLCKAYLDPKQLERDLAVLRAFHFGPKALTDSEIAGREGVSVQTARRARGEMGTIFKRRHLSLASSDDALLPILAKEVTNPATVDRNLRIFRLASNQGVTSAEIAKRFGMDESNVRQIRTKLVTIASKIGIVDDTDPEKYIADLRKALLTRAREKAAQQVALRMQVVQRVAQGEKLADIGATFRFSESNVRQILDQARALAMTLGLREATL